MERRRNYIFNILEYIQCIVDNIQINDSLFHKISLKRSEARKMSIKSFECFNMKVSQSNLSFSTWKKVNLNHVEMKDCQIEGLKINGYLISDLIKEKEAASITLDDEMQ